MGLGASLHNHKAKIKKDTNNNTFGHMQKPGTLQYHKSITSHFDVINRRDQRARKQRNIDSDKQTLGIKNPHKNKL